MSALAAQHPQSTSWSVSRTASNFLPVYTDVKSGAAYTLIRHVRGDIAALSNTIKEELLPKRKSPQKFGARPKKTPIPISVNTHTNTIALRGNWRREVVDWLSSKGF
ncbi:54S ribosomal protein L49, mitochondrial [Tulasnella sp. 418]|nr:54S ribosomal protein L49, mitochondrial [Tulasnella sp. 418]